MQHALRVLVALALVCVASFAYPAVPRPVPNPILTASPCGDSIAVDELVQGMIDGINAGLIEEVIELKDAQALDYIKRVNSAVSSNVPETLTHIFIAVLPNRSAILFGISGVCVGGNLKMQPGLHQKVYGTEASFLQ